MARGDAYYEEGRFSEAIIEYRSAQQIDPNYPDAHYNLSRAYFKTDKARDGFWELRETVRLDPENREALIEFSQLQVLANEAEEALANMDAFLVEDDDVRGHVVRGQALDMLDRFDEANEAYKNAFAADPEHEIAMRALARSEMRAGRKGEARVVWEKLVEVHPTFENFTLVARAATQLVDDRKEALALREQAALRAIEVAEGDDRPGAYEQAASFYILAGRTPDAFALLEKGLEAEEDPVDVMYILARLHQGEGNVAEADAMLEKAALARPDDSSVHRVLAAFRSREGNFESALESIERAAEIDPSDDLVKVQKAEILMELGFRQGRAGGSEEAREILVEVLEREPSNLFALVAHAKYRLGNNDPDGAVKELRQALEMRPDWAEASYLLGIALVSQEDYANGRVELARALELDPNLFAATRALAEVHFKLGEWQYAIDRARDYLAIRPEDDKARLLMAQSMVSAGYSDAAAAELEQIPPGDRGGEVLFALGRVRHASSEFEAAREFFEAANEKLPGNWEVLQSLMALDRRDGRMEESKARIDAALEVDPESAQLYQLRGVIAFNEGDNDAAERDFKKAIEMEPEDLAGYQRLARFYAVTGRLEETTQIYESAIAVRPEAAQFHHFLGVLYELSGDPDRAIQRYESAIQHGDGMAESRNNLAYLYADRGERLDRALDLAQEAKQMLPENPSVSDTLGWVLFKRGVPSAAVSYLKDAEARTDPNDASIALIRFHLAQAHSEADEDPEALEALERSLESLEVHLEAVKEQGSGTEAEPDWASEAREMHAKLKSQQAAAN